MVFAGLFSHRVSLQTLSCLSDSLHGDNIAATAPGISLMVRRWLPQPQAPHLHWATSPSGKEESVCVVGGTVRVVRECSPLGLLPFYQGEKDVFLEAPEDFALYTIGQNVVPWPLLAVRDARIISTWFFSLYDGRQAREKGFGNGWGVRGPSSVR